MIMTSTLSIMFIINWMLPFMIHPLAITLAIILQTLLLCMIMGSMSYSFWFSYILFLIFLGGMLILFMYMTSLAPNEMFFTMMNMTKLMFPIIMITLTFLLMNHYLLQPQTMKQDKIKNLILNSSELPFNLLQLYNMPFTTITIMVISYLLATLIIIVKITQVNDGPLRQKL